MIGHQAYTLFYTYGFFDYLLTLFLFLIFLLSVAFIKIKLQIKTNISFILFLYHNFFF